MFNNVASALTYLVTKEKFEDSFNNQHPVSNLKQANINKHIIQYQLCTYCGGWFTCNGQLSRSLSNFRKIVDEIYFKLVLNVHICNNVFAFWKRRYSNWKRTFLTYSHPTKKRYFSKKVLLKRSYYLFIIELFIHNSKF